MILSVASGMPRFVVVEPSGVYGLYDRFAETLDASLDALQWQLRHANATERAAAVASDVTGAMEALPLAARAAAAAAVAVALTRRLIVWWVARRIVARHDRALRKLD